MLFKIFSSKKWTDYQPIKRMLENNVDGLSIAVLLTKDKKWWKHEELINYAIKSGEAGLNTVFGNVFRDEYWFFGNGQ